MPKKKEILIYEFDELSEEAKERAIELLVDDGKAWTDSDAEGLSETFEDDLAGHYGLGNMEVCWSLSSCQGDGVAFWGKVDVEKFVNTEIERDPKLERFRKLIPFVSAKIAHKGRYCHENSMEVELEVTGNPEDLIPDPVGREYMDWEFNNRASQRHWAEEKYRIMQARRNPIAYWEEQKAKWEQRKLRPFKGEKSPKAWAPGEPGPMPAELNLEIPPQPSQEMPAYLQAAFDKASGEWHVIEVHIPEFEYHLKERIQEISREMEKSGYGEMDYFRSREFMEQRIEDRGWKFLEDGKPYKE